MTSSARRPSFQLTFAGSPESAPPLAPDDPEALVWLSPVDGSVWAYGNTVNGERWLRIPGIATYRFGESPGAAAAIPDAEAEPEAVEEAYRRAVLPMALHVHGLEVLHASAVRSPRGVLAFCAHSHGGKSTVAYGLATRDGYEVWADDAVAFEAVERRVDVIPLPFTLRLRAPSSAFFSERVGDLAAIASPPEDANHDDAEPAPLAGVFLLERVEDAHDVVRVETLGPAEAFAAVFAHAYWFDLRSDSERGETMRRYLDLVARVPVRRVRYRSGFEHLPQVLDAIEEAAR